MLKGANKYKSLLQNGKWKEPTEIDKELMAMSTEIAKLKNETKYKKDKNTTAITMKQSNGRIPSQHWRNRPQWLRNHIPPDNVKEIRKWHNTEFYYCCKRSGGHYSGIWTRHHPSKCNPDYVKRFHKYKQKKNNPKKRVTFDNEQNKEKKATPKEKK